MRNTNVGTDLKQFQVRAVALIQIGEGSPQLLKGIEKYLAKGKPLAKREHRILDKWLHGCGLIKISFVRLVPGAFKERLLMTSCTIAILKGKSEESLQNDNYFNTVNRDSTIDSKRCIFVE